MPRRVYRFDRFELDPEDRRLTRDGATVEISGRYLDALVLMVSELGRLVTKDQFLDEVWKGMPVTDEALTQAIRSLRRALGDDAARPRMIETAPKHGYRFIAPVTVVEDGEAAGPAAAAAPLAVSSAVVGRTERALDRVFEVGRAGTLGGGAAGAVGGLVYGALGVLGGEGAGASGVLVMICVTALVGLAAGRAWASASRRGSGSRGARSGGSAAGSWGGWSWGRWCGCWGWTLSTCCSAGRRARSPGRWRGRCWAGRSVRAWCWASGSAGPGAGGRWSAVWPARSRASASCWPGGGCWSAVWPPWPRPFRSRG